LLYQTNYTREMIERVGIDSKIEIVCPSTAKSELKMIVEFLYSGKISGPNQNVVYQASQNLTELFGFPDFSENPGQSFSPRKSCRKPTLNPALIRHDLSREIKVENDSDEDSTKLEEMNVKFEQNECDNISGLGIKSEEDFESGLKFEDSDIVMEVSEGINENLGLRNYMTTSERKLKVAKKPHFCSLGCGKKFGGQQSMRLHVSKACKMNPDITAKDLQKSPWANSHICFQCKEVFDSKVDRIKHVIMKHPEIKIYDCSICEEKYVSVRGLAKHESTKHGMQISKIDKKCPVCLEAFESRTKMMKHYTSSHPESKIYNCSLCDEHYLNVKGLQKHIFRTHERKITGLGCSFCGKDFESKQELKNHIDTEHETREYECTKCDAKFRSQEGLQSHIEYVHEGKRYQCTTCGEVLESITKLESHTAQVHDRTKLFECPTCKAVYTSERTLKEHISFVHENATGHLCPECGESFRDKRQLRDHIFVVHEGKEYKCGFCSKSYGSKLVMQKHVRTIHQGKKPEPAKCSMCDKYFTTKSQVKIHIQAVHEKKRPYACDLCNLSFAQTAHLKTHMKGKHRSAI